MKAMQLNNAKRGPVLIPVDVPKPELGADEVLVHVHAAGVTPTELLWYPTTHTKEGAARTGAVPGHEFSGVVAAVGKNVRGFKVGDEVYGMNDWFADGATAEFCVTLPQNIARKPATLQTLKAQDDALDMLLIHVGVNLADPVLPDALVVYPFQFNRFGAVTPTSSGRIRHFLAGDDEAKMLALLGFRKQPSFDPLNEFLRLANFLVRIQKDENRLLQHPERLAQRPPIGVPMGRKTR
jgi:alcohol dehydrogenase-like protein